MTATTATKTAATPQVTPMTRREFLYYIWGASMALFMVQSTGLTIWFIFPRFREGEFGGVIPISIENLPALDAPPKNFPAGRFWLVNMGSEIVDDERLPDEYPQTVGVKAIYKVCVHLGCLYKWVPVNNRFECPCHGSKYLASGVRIDGPANRNLDLFILQAVDADGNVLAETKSIVHPSSGLEEGDAIPLPEGTVTLRINTGQRIDGAPNNQPGGGY